jgi:hypothetical protein
MREFKDGYIAGWRWIRGNDDLPTIPACSVPAGETAYRAGVIRGVHDACESPEAAAARSEDVDSILDRALDKKRPRS